jgi:signal transduction histidine kinase
MKKLWGRYKLLMEKRFANSYDNTHTDIDYWRTRLFMQFMLYMFPIGIVVYIPSMIMSLVTDLPEIAIVDTFTIALVIILVIYKKISLIVKKYLLASCLYGLSIMLLLILGSIGPGLIYLVATSIFILLVISKKAAYFSVLLNFCLYFFVALILAFPEIGIESLKEYTLGSWIAVGANFLLINFITVAAVALLLDGLQKTILNEKKLLHKLRKEKKKLKKAKDKAIQSDKFKSAFLANMSHEIRTPLNAIVGFANLLLKNSDPNKHEQYIEIINNSSKQLLNLITDIIDLSKIAAGAVSINSEKILFGDFITSIATAMKHQCPDNLDFRYSADKEDLQVEVGIDVQKVTQIITNLITNAFKYTKEGYVELKTSLLSNRQTIYFSITDTGIGISKENQEIVFQRFYQENALHSGVGLGLSISASLVKSLNGDIGMESEPGKGSTFTVKLPNLIDETIEKPAAINKAVPITNRG